MDISGREDGHGEFLYKPGSAASTTISRSRWGVLGTLSADTAGQLDVLGHDSHTLGMDGAKVGVLEQRREVCLGRLLQRHNGVGLESEVGLEVLGNLTN